jgi:hypothetical protein
MMMGWLWALGYPRRIRSSFNSDKSRYEKSRKDSKENGNMGSP